MLFERCHTKDRNRSLKQHKEYFPEYNSVGPPCTDRGTEGQRPDGGEEPGHGGGGGDAQRQQQENVVLLGGQEEAEIVIAQAQVTCVPNLEPLQFRFLKES